MTRLIHVALVATIFAGGCGSHRSSNTRQVNPRSKTAVKDPIEDALSLPSVNTWDRITVTTIREGHNLAVLVYQWSNGGAISAVYSQDPRTGKFVRMAPGLLPQMPPSRCAKAYRAAALFNKGKVTSPFGIVVAGEMITVIPNATIPQPQLYKLNEGVYERVMFPEDMPRELKR